MSDKRPYILFQDDLRAENLLFVAPRARVIARTIDEVRPAFRQLEGWQRKGYWLAGYIAYEAGFAFEPKLAALAPENRETPLICIGVFDPPDISTSHRLPGSGAVVDAEAVLSNPHAGWDLEAYRQRFEALHRHLRLGDCYQANLTMPVSARWPGDAASLFRSLKARQPVRYGALAELGGPAIVSRSPELFFRVDADGMIETHPMKGTAARGASPEEDRDIVAAMLADEKTLAENRMIVDLLRNDISKIAEVGSVEVPKLFDIETYPTLHQMVSHVRAKLRPDTGLATIFEALFPCGSITGAPKLSAMQILHRLETGPRDVYCGAIGWCDPAGPMQFSVAIRTITLFNDHRAVFNVGGGIVYDSKVEAEYRECLLKARFALAIQQLSS